MKTDAPKPDNESVPAWKLAATKAVLADRERELLTLKGPCGNSACRLHYAHSGPCDTRPAAAASAPCESETRSWDHFTPDQADSYWIRCTLTTPHDEHEDENTGLRWKDEALPSLPRMPPRRSGARL